MNKPKIRAFDLSFVFACSACALGIAASSGYDVGVQGDHSGTLTPLPKRPLGNPPTLSGDGLELPLPRKSRLWSGEGLLVSEPVMERDGQLRPMRERDTHAPITDAWIRHYFSADALLDPGFASRDPDRDGFTNREEFLHGTDPKRSADHPDPIVQWTYLRLAASKTSIEFRGRVDRGSWQINVTSDGRTRTEVLRLGESFMADGAAFQLVGFRPKLVVDSQGVPRDHSEVVIARRDRDQLNQTVDLILGSAWTVPARAGLLRNAPRGEEVVAKPGVGFRLPGIPNRTFLAKAIDPDRVTVADADGAEYSAEAGGGLRLGKR